MPNVYDMAPRCIYFMKPELINLKIDFVLNFNYVVLANILKRIRGSVHKLCLQARRRGDGQMSTIGYIVYFVNERKGSNCANGSFYLI